MPGNPYTFASGYPKDFQIIDQFGQLTPAWQYFFFALWSKTGGAASTINNTYTVIQSPTTGQPIIIDNTGSPVGTIAAPPAKAAAETIDPGTSPFTFHPTITGFLTCFGGQIDYSRDGTFYFPVTMFGGQILVLNGDYVRVTWSGRPPTVTWFPGGIS